MTDPQQPQVPRLSNGDRVIVAIVQDASSPLGVRLVADPNTHPRRALSLVSGLYDDLLLQCAVGITEAKAKSDSRIVVPQLKVT